MNTAVSTRIRNGFAYQAHSAYPSQIDAMDAAFRLRNAGRFTFVTDVRQPVTLPSGETVAVGWAVWVKAQLAEQGRAVSFSIAPDCSATREIVIHDAEGNIIPPGLERAKAIGKVTRQLRAMSDAEFAAQEREARAAMTDETHYSRVGW